MRRKPGQMGPGLRARQYLKDNPKASLEEVATNMACSRRTVGLQRRHLVESGAVPPNYFDRAVDTRTAKTMANVMNSDKSPEVEGVESQHKGGQLTTEESLEMLTRFARSAEKEGNFPLAKDAINAHDRIAKASSITHLGPPDPQTDTQKVERMTVLLDVVGPVISALALCHAYHTPEDRKLFEEEFSRQSVTHPSHVETGTSDLAGDSSNAQDRENKESPQVDSGHAESPPDGDPSVHLSQRDPGLGGHRPDEAGSGDPPKLGPPVGNSGEMDPTP